MLFLALGPGEPSMIDYAKADRQFEAALQATENLDRRKMIKHLREVYRHLGAGEWAVAKNVLQMFESRAKKLGWKDGGTELPRPFNHRHLERLYVVAFKMVHGEGPPRRVEKPKPKYWEM